MSRQLTKVQKAVKAIDDAFVFGAAKRRHQKQKELEKKGIKYMTVNSAIDDVFCGWGGSRKKSCKEGAKNRR